jgi:hypothetical protein
VKKLLGVLGVTLALFSSFFVMAAIGDLFGGDTETKTSVLLGLLVFFSGTGFAGAYLAKRSLRSPEPTLTDEERERLVLRLAADHQGRLTAAEVAAHTPLSLQESQQMLERLEQHRAAELQLTPDGAMVYHFPQLLTAAEKAEAVDVLEA